MYPVLQIGHYMYLITCTCVLLSFLRFDRCRFDVLCNLVKFFFSKCFHVRKRRKPNDEQSTSNSRRRIRFSPSGTTKQSLKRNGPLNLKTIEQSLKRNGPLDAQDIEQILKRNGLLKDSDIAIVLNVHLARRKELVTQRYVVPLQPPSHIKVDNFPCYGS